MGSPDPRNPDHAAQLLFLYKKTLFGKAPSLAELTAANKRLLADSGWKALLKDKNLESFHKQYSHNVGRASSILFFPEGPREAPLPPTILDRLKSPEGLASRNDFLDFFSQFWKVKR